METRKIIAIKDRKIQSAVRRLREEKAQRAKLDESIKAHERVIKSHMGDAEEATVGGVKVATYTTAIRQSISQTHLKKRAREDESVAELLRECTVETEVRTFKLVDPE